MQKLVNGCVAVASCRALVLLPACLHLFVAGRQNSVAFVLNKLLLQCEANRPPSAALALLSAAMDYE